jgi:leucyl/phenylalanyl-tRNA--protein transferase
MRRRRSPHEPDILAPEFLLQAYGAGIFPMGEAESDRISWYRPDPRGVLPLDGFHISRRLARTLRSDSFRVTFDNAFSNVVRGCAEARPVWITERIREAFERLHALGHAHSVEVWQGADLVGGVYGLQLGAAFVAESMFHRVRDASKVALACLVERLREREFELFEIQYVTSHLAQFGAYEMPLSEYLARLARARVLERHFA